MVVTNSDLNWLIVWRNYEVEPINDILVKVKVWDRRLQCLTSHFDWLEYIKVSIEDDLPF